MASIVLERFWGCREPHESRKPVKNSWQFRSIQDFSVFLSLVESLRLVDYSYERRAKQGRNAKEKEFRNSGKVWNENKVQKSDGMKLCYRWILQHYNHSQNFMYTVVFVWKIFTLIHTLFQHCIWTFSSWKVIVET